MNQPRKNKNINNQTINKTKPLFNKNDYLLNYEDTNKAAEIFFKALNPEFYNETKNSTNNIEELFWKKKDPLFYEEIKDSFRKSERGEFIPLRFFIENGHLDESLIPKLHNTDIDYGELQTGIYDFYEPFENIKEKLKKNNINLLSEEQVNQTLKNNNIPYNIHDFWSAH